MELEWNSRIELCVRQNQDEILRWNFVKPDIKLKSNSAIALRSRLFPGPITRFHFSSIALPLQFYHETALQFHPRSFSCSFSDYLKFPPSSILDLSQIQFKFFKINVQLYALEGGKEGREGFLLCFYLEILQIFYTKIQVK